LLLSNWDAPHNHINLHPPHLRLTDYFPRPTLTYTRPCRHIHTSMQARSPHMPLLTLLLFSALLPWLDAVRERLSQDRCHCRQQSFMMVRIDCKQPLRVLDCCLSAIWSIRLSLRRHGENCAAARFEAVPKPLWAACSCVVGLCTTTERISAPSLVCVCFVFACLPLSSCGRSMLAQPCFRHFASHNRRQISETSCYGPETCVVCMRPLMLRH
jgi:hypothetical protein